MPAINDTSYHYGQAPQDAAVSPEVVTLEGGAIRTLQVIVPNGTLRPIDPDTGDTIPITEVRGPSNEALTEYPTTDAVGEWSFALIGYPVCALGITGPESGAVEKIYRNVVSGGAIAESLNAGGAAALALSIAQDAKTIAQDAKTIASSGGGGGSSVEEIYETAAGVYPLPTSTIRRLFIGQKRPTIAQGRRDHDLWRNVVYAT